MPGLKDPNFYRSVSFIFEHTHEGAIGIVINNVHTSITSRLIFQELSIDYRDETAGIPIHIGGPVHMNEIFVLHGPPLDYEQSIIVNPGIAITNSKSILEAIAKAEGPNGYIISLGCAGWGSGQLEFEIKENVWLNGPYAHDIMFELDTDRRWEEAITRMGIDPALLSDAAGHA
ncbi:MAG: YqgE/AlgH family protein [Desulfobacteraceae bacterium]|nr:YqgE/AlgH family protein [Desulfobacteraceae bacterium]